jgi:hypothetical protein
LLKAGGAKGLIAKSAVFLRGHIVFDPKMRCGYLHGAIQPAKFALNSIVGVLCFHVNNLLDYIIHQFNTLYSVTV